MELGRRTRSADEAAASFGDGWWAPNGQPTFEETAALAVATALRALSYGNPRGFTVAAARQPADLVRVVSRPRLGISD